MAQGTGFGKTILIGDQFVLDEVPAIVSAISYETITTVERIDGEGWVLEDNRIEVPAAMLPTSGRVPTRRVYWFTLLDTSASMTMNIELVQDAAVQFGVAPVGVRLGELMEGHFPKLIDQSRGMAHALGVLEQRVELVEGQRAVLVVRDDGLGGDVLAQAVLAELLQFLGGHFPQVLGVIHGVAMVCG